MKENTEKYSRKDIVKEIDKFRYRFYKRLLVNIGKFLRIIKKKQ